MTLFLVVLIVSIFLICNDKATKKVSVFQKKRATKTNVALQKRLYATFWERYKQQLSFVDNNMSTFKTSPNCYCLYDYILDLYAKSGLSTGHSYAFLLPVDHDHGQNELYLKTLGKISEEENKTIYERIMGVAQYKWMLEALIFEETKRSLWKKGYHFSPDGKESAWQEIDKVVDYAKCDGKKYPWDWF